MPCSYRGEGDTILLFKRYLYEGKRSMTKRTRGEELPLSVEDAWIDR